MKADERVSDVVRGSRMIDQPCCRVQHRLDGALGRPEGRPVRRYHSPAGLQSETGTYLVALNDVSDAVGVEQQNIAIQYAGRVSA